MEGIEGLVIMGRCPALTKIAPKQFTKEILDYRYDNDDYKS